MLLEQDAVVRESIDLGNDVEGQIQEDVAGVVVSGGIHKYVHFDNMLSSSPRLS